METRTRNIFKSLTIRGALILLIHRLFNAMEWDLPSEMADQILDVLIDGIGLAMVAYGRWRKGDLHIAGGPRWPKSGTYTGACWLLFGLLVIGMSGAGGCGATSQRIKPLSITSDGIPYTSTLIESREDGGSVTIHAPTTPQWSSLDSGGFESTSGQPSGLAFISQFGVGLANPADASFERLEMEFTAEGIPLKLVIEGFNAGISGPIRAQAEKLDRIIAIVRELEETDRATFDAFMETIQEVAPDLFTILKTTLGMP